MREGVGLLGVIGPLDLRPSFAATVLFAIGWIAGWLLLARPRRLQSGPTATVRGARPTVSVIVPARDEEASIGALLASVVPQLREGDELIVVDDHSTDATAALALRAGARVVAAPDLPPGWAGKPHACAAGSATSSGEALVFLDADVTLGAGALDALVAELRRPRSGSGSGSGTRLVSVQPWHAPGSAVEQLQVLCNVVALMGSTAFTVIGARTRVHVAFGPVLACTRADYATIGGHGHADVRGAILEDIALARLADDVVLFTGRPDTTFRMYPGGWRPMVEGWTKGMGIGIAATPWWALALVIAWIASLAGGWLVSPWFALASLVQLAVLARRAGRWSAWIVVIHPLATAWFVAVALRSAWRRVRRREVSWKGRRLTPEQQVR